MPKAKAMTETKALAALRDIEFRAGEAYRNIDWQAAVALTAIIESCTAQFPDLRDTVAVEWATYYIDLLRSKLEAFTSGADERLDLGCTPVYSRISDFIEAAFDAERITRADYYVWRNFADSAFENGLDVERTRFWEESPDRMICGTLDCYLDSPKFHGFEAPSDTLRAVIDEAFAA